jgi:cobalt-zinc-cadmium efflux system membrane fusion protein
MDPRVIPDLSVSVDVVVNSETDAVIAPRESVFQTGDGEKPYVFVQTESGWQRREVELGRASHTMVAVRDGLRAGEVVALERPPSTPKKV